MLVKGHKLTLLCICLILLNILQYSRYDSVTCQNIRLSNNLHGELFERKENPKDQNEKEDFWDNGKEDGGLIALQSIFDAIEDTEVPLQDIPIKHRHSALSALKGVSSDIRMMHRHMARLAMKLNPSLKVDVQFYGNFPDPNENVFDDFRVTSYMPLASLQNAYEGKWSQYSAIFWIANSLNIIDITTIQDGIETVSTSSPGTLLCGNAVNGKSCVADAMMFTPETGKMIYMRIRSSMGIIASISQKYTQPSSIINPLSGFLGSESFEIRFNKKMNLSLDKISKAYQLFTAHSTKRNLPKYLRETQIVSQQKRVKFIQPPSCSGDGFVSFIKSSRKGSFRRDEIRKYYMEILKKQYQDSFHLFFLLGSPSSKEEKWLTDEIKAESEKHNDIVLYDYEDNYENLPMKTFAGYQFFNDRCMKKKYAIFHDDDIFIKLNELEGQLKKLDPSVPEIKCLKGKCIPEAPAMYFGKYYTWIDLYPPMYFIPTYSNGQATALTASAARKIYEAAKETDYREFRIEDMLYTGILRVKAGISKISGMVLQDGGSVSWHKQGMSDESLFFQNLTLLYKNNELSLRAMQ
ncbi:Oidioi.mRNA.OKI2018_I69.PAR.g9153.t1.cds [Oikopleura dioica]|uniref:Oidioi.mRNA.OKI2018_I69.PAR.g9153.t1.cds n=1 Tax=Oikopleura dioica TaxID=34765 RepID=A0ABN7RJB8_OIKDI|nr:Oidioi.mRNA.OKI2018_I69.PAR.g9153.t1.cds [Oikopleura dioica]